MLKKAKLKKFNEQIQQLKEASLLADEITAIVVSDKDPVGVKLAALDTIREAHTDNQIIAPLIRQAVVAISETRH